MKLFLSSTLMVLLYLFSGMSIAFFTLTGNWWWLLLVLFFSLSAGTMCNHIYEPRNKS
jgi:hypothetical protein